MIFDYCFFQPTLPVKKENERETKIQYVYKHGTQTIVVDRPLTEEELSKLKFPLPNNRIQQQQQQATSQQAKQAIVVARPSAACQPVARVVVPSAPLASSVDTLANTLISQIQTPVQVNLKFRCVHKKMFSLSQIRTQGFHFKHALLLQLIDYNHAGTKLENFL
jgi:hypothetical protein